MPNLLALLPLLVAQDPRPAAQVDWAELMRRFQADAALLQKTGAALDLAALKVEKLPPGELARELGKRETAFFGEGWYETLWMLAQAFGRRSEATADAFTLTFQRASTGALPARYFPARKAIVIDEDQYTQDARFDRALLHALALAGLDQQAGGLAALRTGPSTEEILCDRAWIEGRAESQVRAALGVEPRTGLSAFEQRTGGFMLVDLAGEAWVKRADARPPSGRALLHGPQSGAPGKLTLALAPSGAKLVREDSLGELGLRFVLSTAGAHPLRAIEAGIGLVSDRLLLWKYGEREREFAWRLVFASERDATELEHLLEKLGKGTRVRRGAMLDWSFATRPDLEAELAKLLAALPPPPAASEAEASAAAELQAQCLALQPHMEGERWLLPELDLAWKLFEGCKPSFFEAEAIVYLSPPVAGFRDNLIFSEYALPEDATPEKVLEGTRKSFERLTTAKLLRAELVHAPAGEGVLIEYTQSSSGKDLHQLELQLVLPGRKQTLTATLLEAHWKITGAQTEALLLNTERIRPPAAPGTTK